MKILVVLKMVPDVVEELVLDPSGRSLDLDAIRMTLNGSDDDALEEALLLKERSGAAVTVVAGDAPEVDDALFTALAKGADRAVRVVWPDGPVSTRATGHMLAALLRDNPSLWPADLILTGTQASDDLDGLLTPALARSLDLPWLSVITRIGANLEKRVVRVVKEFSGGVRADFDIPMPCVLGVQAAEKPPRYVPVAKVRAAMKSQAIDTVDAPGVPGEPVMVETLAMSMPLATNMARMLDGSPERVSEELCGIFAARGLL